MPALSEVHPNIPKTCLPAYSDYGDHNGAGFYRIQDDMTLRQALYALDGVDEMIVFDGKSVGNYITLHFFCTRPQYVAIMTKLERTSTRQVSLPNHTGVFSGTGSVIIRLPHPEFLAWTPLPLTYEVVTATTLEGLDEGTVIDTLVGMETDGCMSSMCSFLPVAGDNYLTIRMVDPPEPNETFPSPEPGTLLKTQIAVIGVHPF